MLEEVGTGHVCSPKVKDRRNQMRYLFFVIFLPVPWHWPHRCSAAHPAAPSSARPAWGQGLCFSHPSINQIQLSNQLPYVDPHNRIPEPGGEKMAKNFYQKSLKLEYFILYFIHFKIYFFKINAVSLKTYKKYWYFPYQLSFKLFFL